MIYFLKDHVSLGGNEWNKLACFIQSNNILEMSVFHVPQLPGKRGDGPKGWAIQAKLDVLIWLGLHKHKKDYLKDAPKGFQMVSHLNGLSMHYVSYFC